MEEDVKVEDRIANGEPEFISREKKCWR